MKKIISFLLILTLVAFAPTFAQVTFSPAVFTAEDEVTLTVDVTGTPMAGQTEAYIWIFSNVSGGGKDGFTNTSWTNSPANARMTAAGTNRWSYKFTGTTMFGQTPAELKDFGFLVKSRDGSRQTPDYKPFAFDPLVFTPTKLRVFPSKVGLDDVVSVFFDQTLSEGVNEARLTVDSATVALFKDTVINNKQEVVQVGPSRRFVARNFQANIAYASFIPNTSFTIPAGTIITRFRYRFTGRIRDVNGALTTVSTSEAEATFATLK
jgi:hypothetical protein